MSYTTKFKFHDREGKRQEGEVSVADYAKAGELGLSLSQYMTQKFRTDEAVYGSVLSQALASNNIVLRPDAATGLQATTLKQMFDGVNVQAGAIVSPDGTGNNTPAGRIFFPEVTLQLIASALQENNSDFFTGYNSLLSGTDSVAGSQFNRPRINVEAPKDSEAATAAQLAEPVSMVTITATDHSYGIPSKAIGLTISDQAAQNSTIDLVSTIMTKQAEGERLRMVEGQIADVFNGNTDLGMSALSSITAQSLDALVTSAGAISQKAWVHYLRDDYKTININKIVMDIDTALAIESRANKPNNVTDDPRSPRIDSLFDVDNLSITRPSVFLVDTAVVGANTMVGLDTRYALRRVVNVNASYSAIENFVMRRATSFRVDYGEALYRLYDEALKKMTLTVA